MPQTTYKYDAYGVALPLAAAYGMKKINDTYEDDLQDAAHTKAVELAALLNERRKGTHKTAGILDFIRVKARDEGINQAHKLLSPASVSVDRGPSNTNVKIDTNKHQHILNDLWDTIHGAFTGNDPNNHKKKALLGFGTAAAGLGTSLYNMSQAVKNTTPEQWEVLKANNPKPDHFMTAMAVGAPLAAYYAWKNRDRKGRAAAGVAASGAMAAQLPHEGLNAFMKMPLPLGVAGAGAAYALDEIQQFRNDEEKQRLMGNPDVAGSASRIHALNAKEDFTTRYPIFRAMPLGDKLQQWYYSKKFQNKPILTMDERESYQKALMSTLESQGVARMDAANRAKAMLDKDLSK